MLKYRVERWLSGRKRIVGNDVCSNAPQVRILSFPQNTKTEANASVLLYLCRKGQGSKKGQQYNFLKSNRTNVRNIFQKLCLPGEATRVSFASLCFKATLGSRILSEPPFRKIPKPKRMLRFCCFLPKRTG